MHIPLAADLGDTMLSEGNFGERLEDGRLLLPPRLIAVLKHFGVSSAEEFVGALEAYPNAFRQELKWRAKHLRAATQTLLQTLSVAAPGVPWRGNRPRKRSFGARPVRGQKQPNT